MYDRTGYETICQTVCLNLMVTIFTPTYNRGYIIGKLYSSLCNQTCKDFEWIVVDDGSTDNTELLICSFIDEGKIPIRYIRQQNGGKHRAVNRGVREACGELFFIVDSDDVVTNEAVEIVVRYYNGIKEDCSFAGICGVKVHFDGTKVGGECDFGILDCNSVDLRYKCGIRGDMAEVFRTEILRKYPFPEIEGEKFCSEALVWNRIAKKYRMRYFYKKIYKCEYLPDGLTANIIKVRVQSPMASMMYYSELSCMDIPIMQKIKATINFWRFACCSDKCFWEKAGQVGVYSLWLYPLGVLFHLRDLYLCMDMS